MYNNECDDMNRSNVQQSLEWQNNWIGEKVIVSKPNMIYVIDKPPPLGVYL